jgi:hypothetical protein
MQRVASVLAGVVLLIAASVVPVAADTTGGGPGTNFSSFAESCSTTGGRQVCTDTNLFVSPNGDGTSSGCLDIFTFANTTRGKGSFVSDQFGCNPAVDLTVGSDYSVTLPPTTIPLQTCAAHKRTCTGSTDTTVSANDTVTGDIAITTTRSTTTVGGCTYKTTTNETDANLTGSMTIGGTTIAEDGFLSVVTQTSTVRCK